jgi:hypothetical protein
MDFNEIRALYIAYFRTGIIPVLSRVKNYRNKDELLSAIYIISLLPYSGKDLLVKIDESAPKLKIGANTWPKRKERLGLREQTFVKYLKTIKTKN